MPTVIAVLIGRRSIRSAAVAWGQGQGPGYAHEDRLADREAPGSPAGSSTPAERLAGVLRGAVPGCTRHRCTVST